MYTQHITSSAKVQAPPQMTPSNVSLSMIEWAQHQQRQYRQVDSKEAHRMLLKSYGLNDTDPSELFA